jgi:hypothetical protein
VLHFLEHLEQNGAFFPGCLCVRTCLLFSDGCRVECRTQQGILTFEGCNCLLHECSIGRRIACRVLPRGYGARRRILERCV